MYLIGGREWERLYALFFSLLMKYSLSLSSKCWLLMGDVGTAEEKTSLLSFLNGKTVEDNEKLMSAAAYE